MKSIQIGKVNEGEFEYSQDGLTATKCLELKKDFEILRKKAEEKGYFKPSVTFFMLSVAHIILLEIVALAILYNFGNGWLPWLASAM